MNIEDYFKSLTLELNGLKNRVRNFIDDAHWQTDGEWKESVLRAFLSRSVPDTVKVGRGFIITPTRPSTQIDILLYSADSPLLFRDGDLVFIPPEAAVAAFEIKSFVNLSQLKVALRKLAEIGDLLGIQKGRVLFGLFSYGTDIKSNAAILEELRRASANNCKVIDLLCLGDSIFVKYWPTHPVDGKGAYEKWDSYTVPAMAPGFFIHNVLLQICPHQIEANHQLWFPKDSQEVYKDGEAYREGAVMEKMEEIRKDNNRLSAKRYYSEIYHEKTQDGIGDGTA